MSDNMTPTVKSQQNIDTTAVQESYEQTKEQPSSEHPENQDGPPSHGLRVRLSFWGAILSLCFTSLLGSFENVITTSMSYMVRELKIGSNYVWITNGFFVASAAIQPLLGQLADVFGRRRLTLVIVATHTLGSGICGGAKNAAMLFAGRAIQGVGSGGINMIIEVIISDLVPLRKRGYFMSLVLLIYALGLGTGPLIGGSLAQNVGWRWVFWINLPIGGTSLILLYLLLRVKDDKTTPLRDKIQNIDYIGNIIIIGSTVSVLYALTVVGSLYSWGAWQTLTPLLLGFAGFFGFICFEGSRFCPRPVIPLRFFKDRTRAVIFVNTLFTSILSYWMLYFRPLYFQAVLLSSPTFAGIQMLPSTLGSLLVSAGCSAALSWVGRYKAFHNLGFGVLTLGLGLHALLDRYSSPARWVIFQILTGSGIGMVLNTLLPALQASLPETDVAAATGSWAFIRSFGNVWGVAIPVAVFNNHFEQLADHITDEKVRQNFLGGHAYEQGTQEGLVSLENNTKIQVVGVFERSLQTVWFVSIAFSAFGFLLSLLEKEIHLRKTLETKYGLHRNEKDGRENGGLRESETPPTTS
ncbi:major facilitator superfamily transporter [Colletotrichum truncatum]|uniref:Major facilitator superfamily transporter n=1 Tax=Colletotrichum truncatum TaxID=5467 RepID=A0ACC3YGU2_COLTU|nr:major facilitator superfamily transporter [Colletotrichum truncatum]KAF6784094.1 major facilitator superfamily transporter [Colletotrichum truncatum]